jgi:RNA polymerase sigma factor (sigma-70 family)
MWVDGSVGVEELIVVDASTPIAAGADDGSLEGAYRTHFPALMRVAFLMTGSNAVAEDLVHDVFVRSSGRVAQLDDPKSYLRAAVVNACRRYHRREGRLVDSPVSPIEPEPSTADAIAMRRALLAMSPNRRAAVVLRYYADLTHDDIAAVLGCRPATARSLVRRGLDELRGVFDES